LWTCCAARSARNRRGCGFAAHPDLGYEKPLDLIERGEYRRVIGAILALAEGVTA